MAWKHGPLNWRNLPRERGETLPSWFRRWLKTVLVERAGSPFELLSEIRHPVVRAEGRRTAAKRRRSTAFCTIVPLALAPVIFAYWLTTWELQGSSGRGIYMLEAGWFAGLFCAFWPLVMYASAAFNTAGAVMEEIEQETAIQLVLTPVPARPLAAAKILPRMWPYFWGIVAALPLYMMAGWTESYALDIGSELRVPSPLLVWPLRFFALVLPGAEMRNPLLGTCLTGPLMCVLDLTLVWTAALWGTVFAVGERGLLRTSLRLVVHLAITSVVIGLCLLGGLVVGAVPMSCAAAAVTPGDRLPLVLGAVVGTTLGLALFGFLWWKLVLCRPADETLTVFQAFDRLANEEFSVGLPKWVEGSVDRGPQARGLSLPSAAGPPVARRVPDPPRGPGEPPSK